jgi:hemolysin activation/secretion protein
MNRFELTPIAAVLAIAFSTAFAVAPLRAAAAPPPPDSGNLLQQVKPVTPQAPSSNSTGLTVQRPDGTKDAAGAAFPVSGFAITGNTLFDSPTLLALVDSGKGQSLNVTQLGQLAGRITEYYHAHGYPLARAIVPAQTIKDGMVTFQVLEARYGTVSLENHSHVRTSLLAATLAPLAAGEFVEQTQMDHVLLLLSDIPKVAVHALINPGQTVGTSDLLVDVQPGPRYTGIATVDDYGNRYTGRMRAGATVSAIDPLGQGDYLSLGVLTSGHGLNYGRLSYEATLTGVGTRAGAAYSALHYVLGDTLEPLEGHGTASVASAWVKQPVARSPLFNANVQLQYDGSDLRDHLDAAAIKTDRHVDAWTASLSGDRRDSGGSGGVSTANFAVSSGRVAYDNGAAQLADATGARTEGGFGKASVNLARLQSLPADNSLYLNLAGQISSKNLDSSQKMTAGGPYTVRAYDLGVLAADKGLLATVELRHELGMLASGQVQALVFADAQRLAIDHNAPGAGANDATLSGFGGGLNWAGPHLWTARAYVAARVGAVPEQIGSAAKARLWAEVSKEF